MFEILHSLSMSYYLTIIITIVWIIDHARQNGKINKFKEDINNARNDRT